MKSLYYFLRCFIHTGCYFYTLNNNLVSPLLPRKWKEKTQQSQKKTESNSTSEAQNSNEIKVEA